MLNGEVFGGRIATLVFKLCRSWRGGNRAACLACRGVGRPLDAMTAGMSVN